MHGHLNVKLGGIFSEMPQSTSLRHECTRI